ncbi:MAG: transcriptional repressor NrdR [Alphaproteobacteria bacterium]|nr:MAG: transcriptional repressor NrdR [Alphaproteobacteria bacterium]
MKCPFCGHTDTQVKDSRPAEENAAIRRRRTCGDCNARFTTFERVQLRELTVLKQDGRRETFDRDKLIRSLRLPLQKRPVGTVEIECAVSNIVRRLEESGESDVTSLMIGEQVMAELAQLDSVAYVRYASIYKDFREVSDFNTFVSNLNEKLQKATAS